MSVMSHKSLVAEDSTLRRLRFTNPGWSIWAQHCTDIRSSYIHYNAIPPEYLLSAYLGCAAEREYHDHWAVYGDPPRGHLAGFLEPADMQAAIDEVTRRAGQGDALAPEWHPSVSDSNPARS